MQEQIKSAQLLAVAESFPNPISSAAVATPRSQIQTPTLHCIACAAALYYQRLRYSPPHLQHHCPRRLSPPQSSDQIEYCSGCLCTMIPIDSATATKHRQPSRYPRADVQRGCIHCTAPTASQIFHAFYLTKPSMCFTYPAHFLALQNSCVRLIWQLSDTVGLLSSPLTMFPFSCFSHSEGATPDL